MSIPFACDMTAIRPEEREAHHALTRRLMSELVEQISERRDGLAFRFPADAYEPVTGFVSRILRMGLGGLLAATALTTRLSAQTSPPRGPEPPSALVAVFPASLYNDQANVREASDTAVAAVATEVIRSRLQARLDGQLAPFEAVDSLQQTPASARLAGGVACNVRVACAIEVGRSLGARWVVLTKVSKTSNLIWLLSAQLVRVSSGDIVLDDSTELKGEPVAMVRVGVRSFADRVARTVRAGGFATNFPAAGIH